MPTHFTVQQPEAQQDMGKVIASPRAKKLAKEIGSGLASVAGTGKICPKINFLHIA